jgi:hypothetical protein
MSNGPETPVRSPAYPVWPLSQSITAVAKIEAQYRSAKVDREIAAKIIGYSGLSGPANKSLAALAQYGLVERAGKGEMRVTERARTILYTDDASEKRTELRAAAFEPQLFRELQDRWPNMTPPEDGVVMYLNRKGFNQTAIRPAAKAYLQTLLFLEEAGGNESHGVAGELAPISGELNSKLDDITMDSQISQPGAQSTQPPPLQRQTIERIAAALAGVPLNRVSMNFEGDKVALNGVLDLAGVEDLEAKLPAIKQLLRFQGGLAAAPKGQANDREEEGHD